MKFMCNHSPRTYDLGNFAAILHSNYQNLYIPCSSNLRTCKLFITRFLGYNLDLKIQHLKFKYWDFP